MRLCPRIFYCWLLFFLPPNAGAALSGYTQDIEKERQETFVEIQFEVPRLQKETTFNEFLFNPLAAEFKSKYREHFGENDTRSIIYRNMSEGGTSQDHNAIEKEGQDRRDFAEYMVKRLIDYHVDNYMRTKPEMKPILEVKEKIQNVKVEINREVKLNIQYNIVGNYADFILDNPYIESKVALEMNPKSYGPSAINEAKTTLSKNLDKYWRSNFYYTAIDGVVATEFIRQIPRHHAGFGFGGSTPVRHEGTSIRQNTYFINASRTF